MHYHFHEESTTKIIFFYLLRLEDGTLAVSNTVESEASSLPF